MSKPIAVLDSGVGGLTVVQELMRQLPREEIVYFGDTARCPYGPRDPEEVASFSYQIIEFLKQYNPKMLVIACNTASAVILTTLRENSTVPVVSVIHPGVREAIKSTLTGRIGIIGTVGTIKSGVYEQALKQIHPDLYLSSLSCPTFVPLVEYGKYNMEEALSVVEEALKPMLQEDIDTLILGCTHYPLLAPFIQRVMGDKVKIISSANETAREISTVLFHKNLLSHQFGYPEHQFFTSGKVSLFQEIAESWLDVPIDVQHVCF